MINGNGIILTKALRELIQEGISSYATKIETNRNEIQQALSGNEKRLSLGNIEELVSTNDALQGQINEAEEILNRPVKRGI